jgi:hypothetical protein
MASKNKAKIYWEVKGKKATQPQTRRIGKRGITPKNNPDTQKRK